MQKTRLESAIETLLSESCTGDRLVCKNRDPGTGLSYLVVNGKAYNSSEAERRLFNKAFARRRGFFLELAVSADGEQFTRVSSPESGSENADDAILRVLADVIHKRRLSVGMSQQELACRAGFTRTYISDMERGARNMSFINLKRLADALGLPMWEMVQAVELKQAISGEPMKAMSAPVQETCFSRPALPALVTDIASVG